MAGDFVMVQCATPRKPEVLRLADLLKIEPSHAFGLCVIAWIWFDEQTEDGRAFGATDTMLDAVVGRAGFTNALADVGWLRVREGALEAPNFDRHMGESAKKRAKNTRRQRKRRRAPVTLSSRDMRDQSATKEEKREEKRVIPPKPPFGTDGYTIAFEMAWSCYPAQRRSGKSTAIAAWRNAVGSLQARHKWNIKQAEGWLLDRVKAFAKTPAASTKFCWAITKWLEEGHYDDSAEAWNGQQKAQLPTAEDQARWTPTGGVD